MVGRNRIVLTVVALATALTLGLSGCGPKATTASSSSTAPAGAGCQSVGSIKFDKTKFVLHAGLAFGAFHHWIWKPYKANAFSKGQKGRITALIKGALAAAFTIHELKVAKADAESQPDTLQAGRPARQGRGVPFRPDHQNPQRQRDRQRAQLGQLADQRCAERRRR
ncbi:hypothetical protein [Fodinicola feengrottensis]|uniref:hypothetical protein n=1 Tax=Fodinicola feengrottensis TaxID=435914 RepID=UPI0013D0B088|nr:hypothetical protein [Fodinicola feengrottensis]